MVEKTIFVSMVGFEDAAFQAKSSGFTPIGSARNQRGEFVVFARKQKFGGI